MKRWSASVLRRSLRPFFSRMSEREKERGEGEDRGRRERGRDVDRPANKPTCVKLFCLSVKTVRRWLEMKLLASNQHEYRHSADSR